MSERFVSHAINLRNKDLRYNYNLKNQLVISFFNIITYVYAATM